jgi:hypothetical protein
MKAIFFTLAYFSLSLAFSQGWRTVDQSDFNMRYKLPRSWEVDGFGGGFGYWNERGSSVCDCAGTINFGYDRTLGMVVYPLDAGSDVSIRNYVWEFKFIETTPTDVYQTKKIKFTKTISAWQKDDPADYDREMMDAEVWRYTVTGPAYGFIIYFWAPPVLLKQNEQKIHKILDSFVMIKQ